jgi:hypothetical protein
MPSLGRCGTNFGAIEFVATRNSIPLRIACCGAPRVGSPSHRRAALLRSYERGSLTPHLVGRLVPAEPDIDRVSQEVVGRPGQIGDLRDELRLDPWTRESTSGDPKRVERGGGTLRGEVLRASGSKRRRRSASTLTGIPVPTRPA